MVDEVVILHRAHFDMMDSKLLFRELVARVDTSYDRGEAEAIVYRLLEKQLSISRRDILMSAEVNATVEQFEDAVKRINRHEPIQYILQEEDFFGRRFYVDSAVLIPRPETEELIRLCIDLLPKRAVRILDVGTGSGCIAITLALEAAPAETFATDISNSALSVASRNAASSGAQVTFFKHNILSEELPYGDLDLLISNPPYISEAERSSMLPNVLTYEPHSALFTGSEDVLIFYRAIASQAAIKLKAGAYVALEINEHYGKETAALFTDDIFTDVRCIKDINQKDRFVIARRK